MADDDLIGAFSTAPRMRPGERVRYVPSRVGFGAFIRSDQVRDPVVEAAQDIAALAAVFTGDATEGEPSKMLPKIRASFKVKRNAGLIKVGGNLRVKVEVHNDADGAALAEFGARNIKRRRALGRAGATFHPHADFKPEGGPGA